MKLGHVHLKVRDLDRSVAFYRAALGLAETERLAGFAFLTGGDEHHTVALQAVGPAAPLPAGRAVGLYHVAFEVDDAPALATARDRLATLGVEVVPVDHGISRAIYFADPDGNGLEIYYDTRRASGTPTWGGVNLPLKLA